MTRTRILLAIGLGAVALLLLPMLPLGCGPTAKPKPAPKPPISRAPIAGHVRSYGWVRPANPPHPKSRYRLKMPARAVALPPSVDLRSKDVPIYDQGQLGSCTANAWAGAVRFHDKNGPKPVAQPSDPSDPSRLFIYYAERALMGTTDQDSGSPVAYGATVISTTGVPPEADWPYDPNQFTVKPPALAYADAGKHLLPAPSSIDTSDLDEVKTALASGHPVVFGFDVYGSFERDLPGGVYEPSGRYMGGHCVEAVGYDDPSSVVIVRNSWGPDWAEHGYFYFPYTYFASPMTSDAWTIAD